MKSKDRQIYKGQDYFEKRQFDALSAFHTGHSVSAVIASY
jgi:hypothetical protein